MTWDVWACVGGNTRITRRLTVLYILTLESLVVAVCTTCFLTISNCEFCIYGACMIHSVNSDYYDYRSDIRKNQTQLSH